MKRDCLGRPLGRVFCCLISIVVAAGLGFAQAPATTAIHDVIYRADGTPASGAAVISWPAFTTADQKPVPAGSLSVQIGAGGSFDVALAPNVNATPAGSYYKVVFHLDGAPPSTETWSVPALAETTISAVRATVMPATAAVQVASRAYVDSVLAGKAASGANADITSLALGNGEPWLQRDAADALGMWRGANAQRFSVYNTRSDAASYERLSTFWYGNTAYLRTESAGTGAVRPLLLGAGEPPALRLEPGRAIATGVLSADGYLDMSGTGAYAITSDPPAFGGTGVGWKLGLWQNIYALGVANNTIAAKTGKWFSVFNSTPANDATSTTPDSAAGVSLGGDGTLIAKNIGAVRYASAFSGADACAKIAAAIADLPATGGTVDARGLQGAQTCAGLTIPADVRVELGAGTITTTGTILLSGHGAELDGVCGPLPGGTSTVQAGSILKLDASAASGTPVVKVYNATGAAIHCIDIDANSVANAIGLQYDSNNTPQSSHGTFTHLDIRNAHQGFVCGNPSETSDTNNYQSDYAILDNFVIFGSNADTTSEGIHINSSNCFDASKISRGAIGYVNKAVHLLNAGSYFQIERVTDGPPVTGGADKEFFSFAATDLTTPDLINNHTESSGWSYAIHDSSCNAGGAYIYSPTWRDNFVGHPILVDGCDNVLSIGTKGGSSTNAFTAAGTSIVYSLFDTMWSGHTTTPWTTSGSGQVYVWSQLGKVTASGFAATTTSSQFSVKPASDTATTLDFDISSPLATQSAGVRLFRLTNTTGGRNFIIYQGNGSGTAKFQVDASNGNTTVGGSLTIGGGSAILKHLSATATLDFAAITAPNCATDLTITVTGAASGDTVALGVPSGSMVAGVQFFAWVSAANTVSVRACAFTGSPNPASGTFRVDVWQH
jgi:hypothetical protein